jgi:uncharacterized protein (TIGR03086 family)
MTDARRDLDTLDTATDAFIAACRTVRPEQLTAATPCPDWDLSQLIDHVTGGNRFTTSILDGEDGQAALAAAVASFDEGHEVVAAAIQSSTVQRAAFHTPGALERRCRHLVGDVSGGQVLRLRLHDVIIHCWDLHQALGSERPIAEDHVRWAAAELFSPESLTARHFATIGGSRPTSGEDLLAVFGRREPGRERPPNQAGLR